MIYFIIIIAIVGIEYLIKGYAEKHFEKDKDMFNGTVRFNLFHNKGIALNLLKDNIKLIKIITGTMIGVLLLILSYFAGAKRKTLTKVGLSLLLGGAISNFLDRMTKGYVTDYLSFPKVKQIRNIVFNLADFVVFIGGILIIIAEAFGHSKK